MAVQCLTTWVVSGDRVWRISDSTCVATCEGHTDAVGAVSFPHRAAAFAAYVVVVCVCVGKVLTALTPHVGCRSFSTPWVVSGSKDKTIKVRFPCSCAPIAGRVT